jgi:hypothetical protein
VRPPTTPLLMRLGRSTWLLAAPAARELRRDAAATLVAPGSTAASCCQEAGALGDHDEHSTSHLLVAATGPQLLPQCSYRCIRGVVVQQALLAVCGKQHCLRCVCVCARLHHCAGATLASEAMRGFKGVLAAEMTCGRGLHSGAGATLAGESKPAVPGCARGWYEMGVRAVCTTVLAPYQC